MEEMLSPSKEEFNFTLNNKHEKIQTIQAQSNITSPKQYSSYM
jgi:hypothetical protein